MKKFSVYIHIPFCINKCKYCDFNSYMNMDGYIDKYIEKVLKDIEEDNSFSKDDICETIYIGGGTPSYINEKYIEQIMNKIYKKYNVKENAEITIEVNPSSVTQEKINIYKKNGINRISIGLQSSNNDILKIIGRKHTFEEFIEKYEIIRKVGFENINVDLMIGLPNQKITDIENSLKSVIRLNPTHISSYSLILYDNTQLYNEIRSKKHELPSDDDERAMYYIMQDIFNQNGYNQYEISNFSKRGFESKHNLMCWNQEEYLGFGAGASSFVNNTRYSYVSEINKYIENKERKIVEEILDKNDLMKEYVILGLRKIEGIYKKTFKEEFKVDINEVFKKELEKLSKMGLLFNDYDIIRLSKKGLDLANIVWEEFI